MISRGDSNHVDIANDEIERLIEGDLTERRAVDVRAHLGACDSCSDAFARVRLNLSALGEDDELLSDTDMVARIRASIATPASPQRSSRVWWAALAILPAAALLLLVPQTEDGWRAKGVVDAASSGITVYRVTPRGPTYLAEKMLASDELLFAYSNLADPPYTHLMIFGVESDRTVRWYYPVHRDDTADPESIEIHPEARSVELSDAVKHPIRSPKMAIYGLFSRRPIRVSEIEEIAHRAPRFATELDIEGVDQHVIRLSIDEVHP